MPPSSIYLVIGVQDLWKTLLVAIAVIALSGAAAAQRLLPPRELLQALLVLALHRALDGLGLLGYEAIIGRDYPIMFATLYVFTLLGLIMGILGDVMYVVIDRRIDFDTREV